MNYAQLLSISPQQTMLMKSLRIENKKFEHVVGNFLASLGALDYLCFYKSNFTHTVLRHTNINSVKKFWVGFPHQSTWFGFRWYLINMRVVNILDLFNNDFDAKS